MVVLAALVALLTVRAGFADSAQADRQASASAPTYAPQDCKKPKVKPKRITFTCGSGGAYFRAKSWSSWNSKQGKGTGTYVANSCEPSCAEGKFVKYPAKIKVFRAKKRPCGGKKRRMFQKARVTFTGKRPAGSNRTEGFGLFCIG